MIDHSHTFLNTVLCLEKDNSWEMLDSKARQALPARLSKSIKMSLKEMLK